MHLAYEISKDESQQTIGFVIIFKQKGGESICESVFTFKA